MKLTAYQKDVINAKICPYCKSKTRKTTETEVYSRTYKNRVMHVCKNFPQCDSYVGSHDDGMPLGRLANKRLRNLKKQAHDVFDKIWQDRYMSRGEAYSELSDFLELPSEFTHIGMFSEKTCIRAINWSKETLKTFIN